MGINYTELRAILERKANKAINHLDELKCFVPEFREVLDSVLYISETLKDLMFLDTECPDCKKKEEKQLQVGAPKVKGVEDFVGKSYRSFGNLDRPINRLVMFYSDSCQPCKYLKPIVEEVAIENNISIEFVLVDTKEGHDHVEEHGIQGWPAVFVVKNDIIEHALLGANTQIKAEETKERLIGELVPYFN